MDQQKLSLPDLPLGEAWTVRVGTEHTSALAAVLHIQTAGGTIISVPIQLGIDVKVVAGTDFGSTITTLDLSLADTGGAGRVLN